MTPHNLDLVDSTTGAPTQFSTLHGLSNELKIATVRLTAACQGGFVDGEVFTGNGNRRADHAHRSPTAAA